MVARCVDVTDVFAKGKGLYERKDVYTMYTLHNYTYVPFLVKHGRDLRKMFVGKDMRKYELHDGASTLSQNIQRRINDDLSAKTMKRFFRQKGL